MCRMRVTWHGRVFALGGASEILKTAVIAHAEARFKALTWPCDEDHNGS